MSKLALQHVISGTPDAKPAANYRRFALSLAAFTALPLVALAAFIVAVDPYYVFGSPSWTGINVVRPYYENRVIISKTYQVTRLQPSAVALGSSRVEVGIDPRHPGWASSDAFNFALPSSNSYAIMLAFLHAQANGRPLKQAIVGLDFFGFNLFAPLSSTFDERRFDPVAIDEFIRFLHDEIPGVGQTGRPPLRPIASGDDWNEALYLAVNPDVANALKIKLFTSGRQHFELAGRAEGRRGGSIPKDWDEAGYLQAHPDVELAVAERRFVNGYHHYLAAGHAEGRLGGFVPPEWNEAQYLAVNPDARLRIVLGFYRSGFVHYASVGRAEGRRGGMPPTNLSARMLAIWPSLNRLHFTADDLFRMIFSTSAVTDSVSTIFRQSEPPSFDNAGMRVWRGHDDELRRVGGARGVFDKLLRESDWRPWLFSPNYMFCFGNPDSGMSTFAPFRFMLRKAYAENTDLKFFITPLFASIQAVRDAMGLSEQYEFWLRELVRVNEQEAIRAGRDPMPLWDFGDINQITKEALPASGDRSPMFWFWEHSHYRQVTGDLILDRIFDHTTRPLPEDFGVRITSANIENHLAHSRERRQRWAAENPTIVEQIRQAAQKKGQNRQAEVTCR